MKHLNEEQFLEWATGERSVENAQHLRECEPCMKEVRELALALEAFKTGVHKDSVSVVPFTGAQIRALAAVPAPPARSMWKLLPVPALAAVVLLAVLLSQPAQVKPPTSNNDAADDALLLAVNADVYRTTPAALRPAAELSKERNQILSGTPQKKK